MKLTKLFILLMLVASCASAQVVSPEMFKNTVVKPQDREISLDLKDVQLSNLISLIFFELNETNYFIHPEVFEDARKVSFRWRGKSQNLKAFLSPWLKKLGYGFELKNDFITVSKPTKEEQIKQIQDFETIIYEPKYVTVSTLTSLISPILKRSEIVNSRAVQNPSESFGVENTNENSVSGLIDKDDRFLVLRCLASQKQMIQDVLKIVDVPDSVVTLQGYVYEVSTTKNEGSALSLFGSILKSKVGIDLGKSSITGNYIKFSYDGLSSVFTVLDSDTRFKVVSNPSLAVRSGAVGKLTVGEDVPTVGSVSTASTGQVTQSIDYKSSGVILEFKPKVFKDIIRVNFSQTISNFVKTENGVNGSPTLIKREARTDIDLRDGEYFVVGGLQDSKNSSSQSALPVPFLSRFMSKIADEKNSELLIVLKVDRVVHN